MARAEHVGADGTVAGAAEEREDGRVEDGLEGDSGGQAGTKGSQSVASPDRETAPGEEERDGLRALSPITISSNSSDDPLKNASDSFQMDDEYEDDDDGLDSAVLRHRPSQPRPFVSPGSSFGNLDTFDAPPSQPATPPRQRNSSTKGATSGAIPPSDSDSETAIQHIFEPFPSGLPDTAKEVIVWLRHKLKVSPPLSKPPLARHTLDQYLTIADAERHVISKWGKRVPAGM